MKTRAAQAALLVLSLSAFGANALAQQRLLVVTTTTDLKSLAEAVGAIACW